jgi:hypothetical protein
MALAAACKFNTFSFYLRNKSPSTLKATQDTASQLEENFTASRKVDLFSSSRASTSKSKIKPIALNSTDPDPNAKTTLTETLKELTTSLNQQQTVTNNRFLHLERSLQNSFREETLDKIEIDNIEIKGFQSL